MFRTGMTIVLLVGIPPPLPTVPTSRNSAAVCRFECATSPHCPSGTSRISPPNNSRNNKRAFSAPRGSPASPRVIWRRSASAACGSIVKSLADGFGASPCSGAFGDQVAANVQSHASGQRNRSGTHSSVPFSDASVLAKSHASRSEFVTDLPQQTPTPLDLRFVLNAARA
jgi:hypothetical protein